MDNLPYPKGFAQRKFVELGLKIISLLEGDSNFFVSPLSIYSALSLVLPGSASASKAELIKTLHLSGDDLHALSKTVGENLQSVTDGDTKKTLVQANGIFMQKGLSIQPDFQKILTDFHKTVSREVSLKLLPPSTLFIDELY